MKKVQFSTVLVFTTIFFQFYQLSALEEVYFPSTSFCFLNSLLNRTRVLALMKNINDNALALMLKMVNE